MNFPFRWGRIDDELIEAQSELIKELTIYAATLQSNFIKLSQNTLGIMDWVVENVAPEVRSELEPYLREARDNLALMEERVS